MLQSNATTWEQLLHTVGGKLELSKCKFTVYDWYQDKDGAMTMAKVKKP
jgi:hypothetical protein